MDKLKEDVKKDHDRLTRVETKLDSVCKTLTDYITKSEKDHQELLNRIDRNYEKVEERFLQEDQECRECIINVNNELKKKVSLNLFMWIVGGLSGVIMTLGILFGTIVISNNKLIAALDHEVADHIAYSVLVYERITGQKWGPAAREDLEAAREYYKKIREEAYKTED